MVAVHVSVTIFSSDLTLMPGLPGYLDPPPPGLPGKAPLGLGGGRAGAGLPGWLGGFLIRFCRSVRPGRHAEIGTWIIDFRVSKLPAMVSRRVFRWASGVAGFTRRRILTTAAWHSIRRTNAPILMSEAGLRTFRRKLRSFFR